ncbi:hypothetical protein QVD17_02295 [Tagetes erecta]|uniref:Uncharacterized protein n=1 Tax=Tagetes erecta TaxID=13708 RepID=A0AAD8L6B6_TARER|nr:hypothetical protein QVD17_02295 [Tagetes erecta]
MRDRTHTASPEATKGGLGPGRGEWPSGQKRQTVNLLKFFYVGSNPASPTCCRLQRREKRHSSAQSAKTLRDNGASESTSSTIPALIPSFRTDGTRLWICSSWSINPSFVSPASGHLRIDLIGRRVRNEDSGLTAAVRTPQYSSFWA